MKKKDILKRVMEALERLAPIDTKPVSFENGHSFIWTTEPFGFDRIENVKVLDSKFLIGIEDLKKMLVSNTEQFANGYSANNVLLWGARGMGKSSLVTSVHSNFIAKNLKLVEIKREDLKSLDKLISILKKSQYRFIVFCDDLSFGSDDQEYKSLKALLDGGLQSRPNNIIFYATSNRRHLMPRDMIENESSVAINASETIEEKISLSDRFGLWLGFHKCTQKDYLKMVKRYKDSTKIDIDDETLFSKAIEWQQTRGSRSGRVAWQFVSDLAGRNGINIAEELNK